MTVARSDVIAYRFHRHQLDREPGSAGATDVDLLDLGVQETGTEGSAWALEVRGARPAGADDLVVAWTLRGAPHAYRRVDVAGVTVATAPLSEADAASRVFDASKPLRENGIGVLEALTTIARLMRDTVRKPVAKGDLSSELAKRLDEPFLRYCRACKATHPYEQAFRLPALQAGLELTPGTSPPVLRRIPGVRPAPYRRLGTQAERKLDVIRGYLRFYGPAPVKAIATYLDAPVADVTANLPDDAVEVQADDLDSKVKRYALAEDLDALSGAAARTTGGVVRLVGSHDPFLQLRDRDVLVPDASRHKHVWPTLGRPGAVLLDGELVATWRPRASGRTLTIQLDPWTKITRSTRSAVRREAERLAAHRGVELGAVNDASER